MHEGGRHVIRVASKCLTTNEKCSDENDRQERVHRDRNCVYEGMWFREMSDKLTPFTLWEISDRRSIKHARNRNKESIYVQAAQIVCRWRQNHQQRLTDPSLAGGGTA